MLMPVVMTEHRAREYEHNVNTQYSSSSFRSFTNEFGHQFAQNVHMLIMHSSQALSNFAQLLSVHGRKMASNFRPYRQHVFWVILFVLVCASLICMIPHRNNADPYLHDTYGHSTNKVPPKWSPEMERYYSLETWMKDVMLWAANALHELDPKQLGPLVAMGLGGEARTIAREMDVNVLQNGYRDPNTNRVMSGLECLLERLETSFGLSAQEQQISSISEFLTFQRQGQETTDQVLTRFELTRTNAQVRGQFNMSASGVSWMLLKVLHIQIVQWPLILHQFGGNLPSTEAEYRILLAYLRRNGHLYDRNTDAKKTLNQPFFANESEAGYENKSTEYPAFFGTDKPSDDNEDQASSAWSDDHEQVDYQDISHLTSNDAAEHIYLQYR